MNSLKRTETFEGKLREGRDEMIVDNSNSYRGLGSFIDAAVYDFKDKQVKITITVEIETV